jgi:hypothetical protein
MPVYEYVCEKCEILFESLLILRSDVERFKDYHPCVSCKESSKRVGLSVTNFSFKAPPGRTQGNGVHGQTGVHDLDYPNIDKAVGRSSNKKWSVFDEVKRERDKVRKEGGSNAITHDSSGRPIVADKATIEIREKALNLFDKANKSKISEK